VTSIESAKIHAISKKAALITTMNAWSGSIPKRDEAYTPEYMATAPRRSPMGIRNENEYASRSSEKGFLDTTWYKLQEHVTTEKNNSSP
jgi:hypothetical protein